METLTQPLVEWGLATFTLQGQQESGDRHVVAPFESGVLVAAIDGLGHGEEAAFAAQLAVTTLEKYRDESVIALVRRCHERLRPTRGAVMSLASFNARDQTMAWIGVGNVEGWLIRASCDFRPGYETLLLRAGVVGGHLAPLQATLLSVESGDSLVLATDGVAVPSLETIPAESAQAIANGILSKHKNETDDALVLVVRWKPS
jgi:negative regulator of sigma-B (phosphoserine phosphatase)